jgi:hypothetical protein
MVASAEALDRWYATDGAARRTGLRGLVFGRHPRRPVPVPQSLSRSVPGHALRRRRVQARAAAFAAVPDSERPAGRLRRLEVPELTATQLRWAPRLYDLLFDPDGRPRPGEGN